MIILAVGRRSWRELDSWSFGVDSFEFCSMYLFIYLLMETLRLVFFITRKQIFCQHFHSLQS